MAWTNPTLRTSGELITANIWNADLVDNMLFLGNTHDHSGDAGDGATATGSLPSGVIMAFDTACPSGWTRVSAFDGLYLRGASSYGGTGGGTAHTHSSWSLSPKYISVEDSDVYIHSEALKVVATSGSGATMYYAYAGGGADTVYPVMYDFASTTVEPSYIEVVFCKKN